MKPGSIRAVTIHHDAKSGTTTTCVDGEEIVRICIPPLPPGWRRIDPDDPTDREQLQPFIEQLQKHGITI